MIKKILPLLLLIILVWPHTAHAQEGPTEGAACTTAGVMARAGGPEITSPNGGNWLICNGSNWIMAWNFNRSAQSQVQFDYDTGACTTAKAGRIRFHSGSNAWTFCNGVGWTAFGRQGADAACNYWGQAPGYVCPDGTVFAGFTPDTYYTPIFTTRCDAGQTWNGSTCTGTASTYTWGSSGTNRNVFNEVDGSENTDTLGPFGAAAHPAAHYCYNLTENSYSDWYLPSPAEALNLYIYSGSIGNISTAYYWTSMQANYTSGTTALTMIATSNNGHIDGQAKTLSFRVRCMRRS